MADLSVIATPVELYGQNNEGEQRRYACADGTGIVKGTILKLTDARTAIAADAVSLAAADPMAGIASMDKVANDGSTSISVWTNGIFEIKASGAITLGQGVYGMANNFVGDALSTPAGSGAIIMGYAMETASDAEVINVRVRL